MMLGHRYAQQKLTHFQPCSIAVISWVFTLDIFLVCACLFWFANFFFLFCFQKNFSTGRAVDACFCFIIIIIIIVFGGFVNIFSVFEVM